MTELADEIARLIEAGDYRAAAIGLEEQGDFGAARDLYEKLFDYDAAGRMAEEQGDYLGALDFFLKGGLYAKAERLRQLLMANLSDDLPAALELFADKSFHLQAAELAESLGQLERAAGHFAEASSHTRAALLLQRLGRLREAGEAWEHQLRGDPNDARACLGLGGVLQRFGRHLEAIALLTRALAGALDPPLRDEAARRVAFGFFKLGLTEAGWTALGRAGIPRGGEVEAYCRPFEDEIQGIGGVSEEAAGAALEGRYRIERPLSGRASADFLARDLLGGTPVVVRFVAGAAAENADYYAELERLRHARLPGSVHVLVIHTTGGFVVTGYPGGRTLLDTLHSERPLTAMQSKAVAQQLSRTVGEAHRLGVLHGSVAPAAVWLGASGACRLDDWAMRHLERRLATRTGGADSAFAYRAPELTLGRPADYRADLYSIAAVLYRCLTGLPASDAPADALANWPEEFTGFFAQALHREPDARFGSHAAFDRALDGLPWERVAPHRPAPAPRSKPTVSLAAAARYAVIEEHFDGDTSLVEDRLLGRRVLRLTLPHDRPAHLVDRLHVLAGPEHPVFQEILRHHPEDDSLILEHVEGDTVGDLLARDEHLLPSVYLDGAEWLMSGLAAAHSAGVGLGTVSLESVLYAGGSLRLPIHRALLLSPESDPVRILADCAGFWRLLSRLAGAGEGGAEGPVGAVAALRRAHLLSRRDHDGLVAGAHSAGSLVAHQGWFQELCRAVDAHTERRRLYEHLQRVASAQGAPTPSVTEYLARRRVALGLGEA